MILQRNEPFVPFCYVIIATLVHQAFPQVEGTIWLLPINMKWLNSIFCCTDDVSIWSECLIECLYCPVPTAPSSKSAGHYITLHVMTWQMIPRLNFKKGIWKKESQWFVVLFLFECRIISMVSCHPVPHSELDVVFFQLSPDIQPVKNLDWGSDTSVCRVHTQRWATASWPPVLSEIWWSR